MHVTLTGSTSLGDFIRMEQVRLRSSGTQAKIIGAVISISGALVIVLYKGPKVLAAASLISSSPPTISLHQQQMTSFESSWIIGGLLLASQYFLISIMYILQVQVLENFIKKLWVVLGTFLLSSCIWCQTRIMEAYPEEIRVVFFYNLIATLISAPVCFLAETDLTSWVLKPDMSLAAIIYSVSIKSYNMLPLLTMCSDQKLKPFVSGSLCFIVQRTYPHLGSASEGSGLCIFV